MRPFLRKLLAASVAVATFALSATAVFAQDIVLIPKRVIYPGETVSLAALREVVLKPGKRIPDAVAISAAELDGKVARRTLLPGRYIPVNSLRDAYLVEQGAPVQVVFVSGGLTISATAISLQPGVSGDVVKVRNIDSGRVFTGIVTATGTVTVGAS